MGFTYFDERLRSEFAFAQYHEAALALALIGIDHFERADDERGRLVERLALREMGRRLSSVLPDDAILARVAGGELAVLCRDMTEGGAVVLAEEVRNAMAAKVYTPGATTSWLTVSIGIATAPSPHIDSERDLVHAAGRALKQAKGLGRNRTVVFIDGTTMLEIEGRPIR